MHYQSGELWGSAYDTIIASGGVLQVASGGVADHTNILYKGYMEVSSGGTANQTTISSGGTMKVRSGGIVNEATTMHVDSMAAGGVEVSGGTVNTATINCGHLYVKRVSGTGNSITLNFGVVSVASGGTLNVAVVNGGLMRIGDLATDEVFPAGTATSITVNDGGRIYVSYKGVANSITLNSGASLLISVGGVAEFTLNSGASVSICSAGTGLWHQYDSSQYRKSVNIASGGTLLSTILNEDDILSVTNGIVLAETIVHSGGTMRISSGGTANEASVNGSGLIFVGSGGTANSTTLNSDGSMCIYSGGTVNQTTVNDGGHLYASSGGTANETIVSDGGIFQVRTNAVVNNTTITSGGRLQLVSGGTANSTTVSGGRIIVDGTANSTTVSNGGYMHVSGDGVANETTVNSGGTMRITSGGTANDTTVNSGGTMFGSAGGILNNTTLASGGSLFVSSGGKLTGLLTIDEGATVTFSAGGVIDFDISSLSPDNAPLVNDLSKITGEPTYTVTLSDAQEHGNYVLAGGADGFADTLSVKCAGESDVTIAVGDAYVAGDDQAYSLVVTDGQLLFSVMEFDRTPPDAPTASADVTDQTNGDVTVTAAFSDDSVLKEYSLDGANWSEYTDPIVLSANGTVYFRGTDEAGNISEVTSYEVSNIQNHATVTNTVAGGSGSFDDVAVTDGAETVIFDSSYTIYNYTDGLTATSPMEIVGNGADATTLSGGTLYLAGNNTSFSGLTLDGNVFGGASGTSADTYDVELFFEGVSFLNGKRIYGGADVSGSDTASAGNIALSMADVDGEGARIFGAGRVSGEANLVVGSVAIDVACVEDGSFLNLFAGADVTSGFSGSITCEAVNTFIGGGEFTYCGNGSQLRGGESVQEDSSLLIIDGTFNHYVYAGAFSMGGKATVKGDSTLFINGGTFNAHVFGGCGANDSENGRNTLVSGGAEIVVNTMENVITFNANLYAGSMGYGIVNGDTSMTFTGNGENLAFGTDSYVTGNSQMDRGTEQYVGGDRLLAFEDFMGEFAANVNNGFSRISASYSNVEFTGGRVALGSVAAWEIEVASEDAALALGDAKNNFKGDTLTLTLAEETAPDTDGWDIITGTDTALRGWQSFSSVTICGDAAAFANGEWTTDDYRLYKEGSALRLAAIA